jgi:hypothetical protein
VGRPAARKHGGAGTGCTGETGPQFAHFRAFRAGENDAQRVEQHQLRVLLDGLRDVFPLRTGDKLRQLLDTLTHSRNSSRGAGEGW